MHAPLRQLLSDLFGPLTLAAYAAWAAVWFSLAGVLAADPAAGRWAQVCCVMFLLVFLIEAIAGERLRTRAFAGLAALLGALALAVCLLAPQSAAPILLVLCVAIIAGRTGGTALWWTVAALNLGLALIMFGLWPGQARWLAVSFAAYASFQLFAALLMQSSRRAEAMSDDLRRVNADLLATRALLAESARDAERLRLSRELHDVAGHALTALKLNLGVLARDTRQPDGERIALCEGLADELLQNLRGVVRQMRASDGIDVREAVARLAAPFPKPPISIDIDAALRVADIEQAETLLRCVQEGLTNAVRHAQASMIWLHLWREPDHLQLTIDDDGRGDPNINPGHGLRGMRERVQVAGGDLALSRSPRGGLRLAVSLPMARP